MRAHSTADLLRRFASSAGFEAAEGLEVRTIPDTRQERSFTGFSHDGRDWFAGSLRFEGGAVIASGNVAAADEPAFRQVERMIAMIAPTSKRRIFRRL